MEQFGVKDEAFSIAYARERPTLPILGAFLPD
jgi:hypothetical protein